MTAKTIEIRDRGTFIPALAIRLDPGCEADRYLLARSGFTKHPAEQAKYVLLVKLADAGRDCCCRYDPYAWDDACMRDAHAHVIENFAALESGAVVDVEFLRGGTLKPKISEAFE